MTRKQIDIIISVAAAILLWFYVINIANPPVQVTLRDIPVTVTGEEELAKNKLAPVTTEGYTATVTVSGPRNVVNKIRPEDVKLSADISDLTLGTGTVQIASVAPSGTTVEEIQNPGIVYESARRLAWNSINVLEIFSTVTELSFVIKRTDSFEAYRVLQDLQRSKG